MFETPRAFSVDVRTPWKEVTQIPEFYFKIRLEEEEQIEDEAEEQLPTLPVSPIEEEENELRER